MGPERLWRWNGWPFVLALAPSAVSLRDEVRQSLSSKLMAVCLGIACFR